MRERPRTTGRRTRRQLVSVTLIGAVAVVSGLVPADGRDGSSGPVSAPSVSRDATDLPARIPSQPPRTPATADGAPSAAPTGGPSSTPTGPAAPDPAASRSGPAPAMEAATPVSLRIPSVGVDSTLVDLGLQADGTLEVPSGGFPAGWYTGAPTPGELGPAIIAGHVDWGGQPGVFFDLREVASGEEIEVTRQDGSTARFRITRVEQFAKDDFPTRAVYGDLDHAGLRLITCGGSFDPQARSYRDNLVVFAELV